MEFHKAIDLNIDAEEKRLCDNLSNIESAYVFFKLCRIHEILNGVIFNPGGKQQLIMTLNKKTNLNNQEISFILSHSRSSLYSLLNELDKENLKIYIDKSQQSIDNKKKDYYLISIHSFRKLLELDGFQLTTNKIKEIIKSLNIFRCIENPDLFHHLTQQIEFNSEIYLSIHPEFLDIYLHTYDIQFKKPWRSEYLDAILSFLQILNQVNSVNAKDLHLLNLYNKSIFKKNIVDAFRIEFVDNKNKKLKFSSTKPIDDDTFKKVCAILDPKDLGYDNNKIPKEFSWIKKYDSMHNQHGKLISNFYIGISSLYELIFKNEIFESKIKEVFNDLIYEMKKFPIRIIMQTKIKSNNIDYLFLDFYKQNIKDLSSELNNIKIIEQELNSDEKIKTFKKIIAEIQINL